MSSISALDSLLNSSSSSSSINLSQILQAAFGASSSGIDVNSAVSAAITAAEAPETTWENQETTLSNQTSALDQIQTDATNLDNVAQSLNSLTGPLSALDVTSSNSDVVSGSAAAGTAPGTYTLQVNNLATTASWTSGTFAGGSTVLPAGSFTITTGSGSSAVNTTINTDGSSDTLTSVAQEINGDDLGVTASVITDASGARLAIVANSSGSAANFSISGSAGYGFAQAVTPVNASVTVDGFDIASATNTVTGAVPGLTLNLLSADPGSQVTLTVAPDLSQATSAIQQFVSDYNTLIGDVNTQFAYSSSSSSQGPLAGDATIVNLQDALLGSLDYTYTPSSGSTTVPNLSALGITINDDGTMSVDSATLQSALQNNFSDVQSFFQGASLNGFANAMDQQLTTFIAPGDGAFTVDLQNISSEYTTLQDDVTNFQTNYIDPLQTQLQAEYSTAEEDLQQLPLEMQQINQELGYNNSSSGG